MGSAATLFIPFSLVFTGLLFLSMPLILELLQTPPEALEDTRTYLTICFAGVPLIVLYNTVSGFFRGMGNTKAPMTFIAISGVVNIFLDYLLIGSFHMSAAGAAWGTFASELVSVVLSLFYLYRKLAPLSLTRRSFLPGKNGPAASFPSAFPFPARTASSRYPSSSSPPSPTAAAWKPQRQ